MVIHGSLQLISSGQQGPEQYKIGYHLRPFSVSISKGVFYPGEVPVEISQLLSGTVSIHRFVFASSLFIQF